MTFTTIFEAQDWEETKSSIYSKTAKDVEQALCSSKKTLEDFKAMISPAAVPYLEKMAQMSSELTKKRFGKTIQMYAPMYLSNECNNICTYCGFSFDNKVLRKTLTDKEIIQEVEAIKRHFNSLEFEVELKRLFDTTAETIWILSPWVRDFAFKNRIPFIQQYLKKGGKIFVAYSKNEADKGEPMVQEESMKKLLELEKNNFNFYFCELEPFHYKNVWLREDKGKSIYYSGSYNILSFFVSQGFKKIRQEKMTRMDWDDELQEQFDDVIKSFGLKYLNKAIEDFNSLSQNPPSKIDKDYLQNLRTVDNSKLKPFINQGIEKFDEAYDTLEETKTENLNLYRKKYFESKIEDYRKQVEELSKQSISTDRKRNLKNEFEKFRDEFIDFLELQMTIAKDVAEQIDNLKTINFSNQQNHNKKRR